MCFSWSDAFIFEETTLMEVADNSTHFEEVKPFLAESIVSGFMTFREKDVDERVELSKSEAQEMINLLATTKVRKTNKILKNEDIHGLYTLSLDNNGYTMSYDVEVFLMFQKNNGSNEVLIITDFSDSVYRTEDLSIYNKFVEIMEKASSDL